MKRLAFALITIIIIFPSCKKSGDTGANMGSGYKRAVPSMTVGYIRGQILSNMVCGSGYVITFDSTEKKFIDPLPAGSGIDLRTATFPIKVKFSYHVKAAPNPCNYIIIDAVEKTD